jgi:ribonucleoside-diphosphate reductase alpha chain
VCNLGSINLEKFATKENGVTLSEGIDTDELKRVSKIVVRMLDNVIDLSEYPIERVDKTRLANRRIGLGVMGFADMLMKLRVGYGTRRGRAIGRHVMHAIQTAAHEMSGELAAEKGAFPNWPASIYGAAMVPRRNSAVTTVAPTGSIAMIFDVSGGLEPYFALSYHYEAVLGGDVDLRYLNKHLVAALEEEGLHTPEIMAKVIKYGTLRDVPEVPEHLREVFVTAMDISADQHIEMQAAFQKETDNSISKTINFRNDATREDCAQGYIKAWKSGCKGCTLYRDGSRFLQVLNLNTDESAQTPESQVPHTGSGKACPTCDASLVCSEGCSKCLGCGYSACDRA